MDGSRIALRGLLFGVALAACSAAVAPAGVVDSCAQLLACCPGLPASASSSCQKDAIAGVASTCANDLATYASFSGCGSPTALPDAGLAGSCGTLSTCCPSLPASMSSTCTSLAAAGIDSDCASFLDGGTCDGAGCAGSAAESVTYAASAGCGAAGTVTFTVPTAGACGIDVAETPGTGLPMSGAFSSGGSTTGYAISNGGWVLGSDATAVQCTVAPEGNTGTLVVSCRTLACAMAGDAAAASCADAGSCTTTLQPTAG
jgi:hypothetical protein